MVIGDLVIGGGGEGERDMKSKLETTREGGRKREQERGREGERENQSERVGARHTQIHR